MAIKPQDPFYVFLPSDPDPEGIYRESNAARFTVPLRPPVQLDENWEMGLVEIFYPAFRYNITEPDNTLKVTYFKTINRERSGKLISEETEKIITIPEGWYTPQDFIRMVNKQFHKKIREKERSPQFGGKLDFSYVTQKIGLWMHPGEGINVTSPKLRRILGFEPIKDEQVGIHLIGRSFDENIDLADEPSGEVDMEVFGSRMFVYTNVTEYSYVGGIMVPILRAVTLAGRPEPGSHTMHRIYENVQYHGLRLTHIDRIETILANEFAEELPFMHGNSMLVIHFRKKQELNNLSLPPIVN